MARRYTTTSEEGFDVRLEARLKNAKLIGARELAGLTAKEAAERIGISYTSYLDFESMRRYPSEETQKKICDFYRGLDIFLFEEDVFPEELKELKPKRKYIAEKTVEKPELISLTYIDKKLLPPVESEAEKKVEYDELRTAVDKVLSGFPYRQQQVIKMRFGLGDEEPKTLEAIGKIFGVTRERIREIEAKALRNLKYRPSIRRKLEPFLKTY